MSSEKIINLLRDMSGGYSDYEVFSDWMTSTAMAIQNSCCMNHNSEWKEREKEYFTVTGRYKKNNFPEMTAYLAEELERDMRDVLGEIYMMAGMGSKATGQFFTPFHLSYLTAQTAFRIEKYNGEILRMNEPSIGGGGMAIAMAKVLKEHGINYQKKLKVYGQDIDLKAVHMSYIQLALLGVDAVVVQQNTLTDEKPSRIYRTPNAMGVLV